MPTYDVRIDRELRLTFGGIKAAPPEEAAAIARDRPTCNADAVDEGGKAVAALVSVSVGGASTPPVAIDFAAERLREAAPDLLAWSMEVVSAGASGKSVPFHVRLAAALMIALLGGGPDQSDDAAEPDA